MAVQTVAKVASIVGGFKGDWSPGVVAPHHLDQGIDPSGAET